MRNLLCLLSELPRLSAPGGWASGQSQDQHLQQILSLTQTTHSLPCSLDPLSGRRKPSSSPEGSSQSPSLPATAGPQSRERTGPDSQLSPPLGNRGISGLGGSGGTFSNVKCSVPDPGALPSHLVLRTALREPRGRSLTARLWEPPKWNWTGIPGVQIRPVPFPGYVTLDKAAVLCLSFS